jgi:hypothetical protein
VDPPQPVTLVAARSSDGTGARTVSGADAAAHHDLEVWFLAPQTAYDVDVTAGRGSASTTFTTGSVPADVGSTLAVTGTSSTPYVGSNLPCTPNVAAAAVWDTATGELVWYQTLQSSGSLFGFNMVQYTEDHTILGLTGSNVVEVDPMGRDLLRLPYTDNFNHDLFRRDGMTWIIYSDSAGRNLTLQGVVVWDAAGTELARFFMDEWTDVPGNASGDWSHMNSVWVDANHDLWLSLYTQDTIVKVDGEPTSATFGEPQWVLAGTAGAGLGQDFAVDWTAVSGTDAFSRQHNATILADGRLAFLDNDSGRGLVVSVDDTAMTAVVDESAATGSPTCGPQGTTMQTAAGNLIVGCSGMSAREYGGGAEVWRATLACDNGVGSGGGGGPGGVRRSCKRFATRLSRAGRARAERRARRGEPRAR